MERPTLYITIETAGQPGRGPQVAVLTLVVIHLIWTWEAVLQNTRYVWKPELWCCRFAKSDPHSTYTNIAKGIGHRRNIDYWEKRINTYFVTATIVSRVAMKALLEIVSRSQLCVIMTISWEHDSTILQHCERMIVQQCTVMTAILRQWWGCQRCASTQWECKLCWWYCNIVRAWQCNVVLLWPQ